MTAVILTITLVAGMYIILRRLLRTVFPSDTDLIGVSIGATAVYIAGLTSLGTLLMPTATAGFLATTILIAGGVFTFIRSDTFTEKSAGDVRETFRTILIICMSALLLAVCLQGFNVAPDGTWLFANKAALDIPYHLSQIIRVSEMQQWDFEEPNFAGEFIRYPYFINFLSGLLLKTGTTLWTAYYIPNVLLIIAGVILLTGLCRELKFGRYLTLIVLAGIFFSGGLGYIAYLMYGAGFPVPLRGGMVWPMQNIAYPSLVPGFLVWQRAFIIGFPLFLAALLAFIRGVRNNHKLSLIAAAVISGFLPFAHMHSFITISAVVAAVALYAMLKRQEVFFSIIRYFVFVISILAIPQLFIWILGPQFPLFDTSGFRLGWMSETVQTGSLVLNPASSGRLIPWLLYMWTNFGMILILPFLLAAGLRQKNNGNNFAYLAAGAAVLWVMPNLIRFQTWDFDNNKLLAYAIVLTLFACGAWIVNQPPDRKKIYTALFAVIILTSVPSAVIGSIEILRDPVIDALNTGPEQRAGNWLRENTPPDAVILSGLTMAMESRVLQEPAIVSSGRRGTGAFVILLYTHGIDSYDRRQVIKAFFENPSGNTGTIKTIPANYLLVNELLRSLYPDLEKELLRLKYPVVFSEGQVKIIKLND